MAADEAPEALAELEDRRRERVLGEPVSTLLRDPLAARLDERIARRGERQLVDHEQGERLPLNVHALPERRGGEEDRVDVVSEALEQALPRSVALTEHGEVEPRGAARDQLVQGAVGRGQNEGASRGEPAQRDDLVRKAVVVPAERGSGRRVGT